MKKIIPYSLSYDYHPQYISALSARMNDLQDIGHLAENHKILV